MGDALSQRPDGLASTIAEVSHHLDTQLPGLVHEKTHVFHSVEDLLNSDYAQRRAFSPEARAQLHTAEGFFDSTTGETVIIASNVELRPDESPRDALTRVIVHERVGHDGLKALLGAKNGKGRALWEKLKATIPDAELQAIANDPAYSHLRDSPDDLAQEWFARKAESSPHLLEKPGLLRDLWHYFKDVLRDFGFSSQGTSPERQLHDLLRLSRQAALRPPTPAQAGSYAPRIYGPGSATSTTASSGSAAAAGSGTHTTTGLGDLAFSQPPGSPARPATPPPDPATSPVAARLHPRITELKAKGGRVTLAEAIELDHAEKSTATERKAQLEDQLKQQGKLTDKQTQELNQAKATLARPEPKNPGPLPAVPQARTTIQNLSKKAAAGTITGAEAHELANAQRAIARKGLDYLNALTTPLSKQQQRAQKRFKAIVDASPYITELPPGPPPSYNPEATNLVYRNWYPPHGGKPVAPPDSAFTPEALALTDSEIADDVSRMKAEGHAVDRHGPDVEAGQLVDRAMFKVDPMTQTKEHGTNPGQPHASARHATQFTSARAMVQALRAVEKTTEYTDRLSLLSQNLKNGTTPPAQLDIKVPLEQALGPNYLKHVRGRTRHGSLTSPSGLKRTKLENGVVFALYLYDSSTKSYKLHTMYPDPQ